MASIKDLGRKAWRKYVVDGVFSSGANKPDTIDIFPFVDYIDSAVTGLAGGGELQGEWNASAGTFPGSGTADVGQSWIVSTAGTVNGVKFRVGDRVIAIKDNPSTTVYATNWIRLPAAVDPVVAAPVTGGTGNAILATTDVAYAGDQSQIVKLGPFLAANGTGGVTVAINGETPRQLVTNTGAAIPSGYIQDGMSALVQIDSDGKYRMFSYGDASAIQAAAEAARDAAEAAAASANGATPVADRAAMKALDTSTKKAAVIYSESGRKGVFNWNSADLSAEMVTANVTTTAVDSGTETATKAAHGLRTGEAAIVTAAVNGLSTGTIYYVIWVDNDTFKLASSFANALSGTAVNLTGTTNFTVKRLRDPREGRYVTKASAELAGSAGAWVRDGDEVNAAQFGASASATDAVNGEALFAAAQVSDVVRVDEDITVSGDILPGVRNCLFVGAGKIAGLRRKQVVSDLASGFQPPITLSPPQVSRLQSSQNPVVVLVGDSIATYNANSVGRNDSLALLLEKHLRSHLAPGQSLTFYNRSIGGQTFISFYSSAATTPINGDETWWVGGQTWKAQVQALNPDIVVFAFGMNDAGLLRPDIVNTLVSDMSGWGSTPQIVFCTNLQPTLGDDFTYAAASYQTDRDYAAGMVRSFALANGHGLLDFNQAFVAARDGFDVRKSSIVNTELASTAVGFQARSPSQAIDFIVEFDVDLDNMVADDAGDIIVVKIGPAEVDWLRISKTDVPSTSTRWQLSSGPTANPHNYKNTVSTWLGSGTKTLRVEVKDNILTVYDPTTGGIEGTYAEALFTARIVRGGGYFIPYVTTTENVAIGSSTIVSSVSFWVAEQRVVRPSMRDRDLFRGAYEGSNYNHPGSLIGAHVYQPVLDVAGIGPSAASSWFYTPTLTGVTNVASSAAYKVRATRVGGIVRVSGLVSVTPTAGSSTLTKLGISLPIPSALSNANTDLAGVANIAFNVTGIIKADVTNDRAELSFAAANTTTAVFGFEFEYSII